MAIVGMNFLKITAEKTSQIKGKVGINNNVGIKSVEKTDFALGNSKEEGLRFLYDFTSKYTPNIGEIRITGDVLILDKANVVKEVMDSWEKDKKIPDAMMKNVLNNVLNKCNIEAMILSRDINLPPPIPMPKVDSNTQVKK